MRIQVPAPGQAVILATDTEVTLTREAYDAALASLDSMADFITKYVGPEEQLLYRVGQVETCLGKDDL